ncbi:hypothetical protein [Oceanobacillus profundus]|nr:hypothetical protein [Oceanobacillus profundus]
MRSKGMVKMVVPHSDCHCDKCMIKYYEQGLIPKGTLAYEDVKRLMEIKK